MGKTRLVSLFVSSTIAIGAFFLFLWFFSLLVMPFVQTTGIALLVGFALILGPMLIVGLLILSDRTGMNTEAVDEEQREGWDSDEGVPAGWSHTYAPKMRTSEDPSTFGSAYNSP